VYWLAGVRLHRRVRKLSKDGRPPMGVAAFRKESYTSDGQVLLRTLMRGWVFGLPFIMLALVAGGAALCFLLKEPARP